MTLAEEILQFWFGDGHTPRFDLWFGKSDEVDAELRTRFGKALEQASGGELDGWLEEGPRQRLAYVVLLDQFTRNLHRGTARMFENDERARKAARRALKEGDDQTLTVLEAAFLYLPFEHSEALADQEEAVARYEALHARAPEHLKKTTETMLQYAKWHEAPIRRFGRFPHRNKLLGRQSTPEEEAFLREPNSSF